MARKKSTNRRRKQHVEPATDTSPKAASAASNAKPTAIEEKSAAVEETVTEATEPSDMVDTTATIPDTAATIASPEEAVTTDEISDTLETSEEISMETNPTAESGEIATVPQVMTDEAISDTFNIIAESSDAIIPSVSEAAEIVSVDDVSQDIIANSLDKDIIPATEALSEENIVTETQSNDVPTPVIESGESARREKPAMMTNNYSSAQANGAASTPSPEIGKGAASTGEQVRYEDYQVMPETPWPPPIFVNRNIKPQERYYIEHRWHSQWRFFDKKASENKNRYFMLQRIVVIGSVTVPVLVSLDPDIIAGLFPFLFTTSAIAGTVIDFLTVVLSLSVAIAAGLESLNKYGDNWGSYRRAAEELQAEKSFYDVKAGRYVNNPDAFSRFVERCEEIIAQQHGRFIASVEKQMQESTDRRDEVLGLEPEGAESSEYIHFTPHSTVASQSAIASSPSAMAESTTTPEQAVVPETPVMPEPTIMPDADDPVYSQTSVG